MLIRSIIVALLVLMAGPTAIAQDNRIQEEANSAAPPIVPLREAIGETALREALDSGRYSYAGNAKCRLCHRDFFLGRKQDHHDHALEPLIGTEHETNGRCLSCHATGYGVKGGFRSIKETPQLMNVQCEGCHGPGSEHIRRNAKGGFLAGPDKPEILQKMCHACHTQRWDRSYDNFHDAYKSYKSAVPGEAAATSKTGK